MIYAQRLEQIRLAVAAKDLKRALAVLNEAVPHRFSAVYRLRDSVLYNLALVDKLGEARPRYMEVVPYESSFCQFVIREGMFITANSAIDSRLDGHPYQGVMLSYTGVPIMDGLHGEKIVGTICHFDPMPHQLSDAEFGLLQRMSRLIDGRLLDA